MPRGKHARKNKRNENLLTTQLMRISLRMDDHIYNDRPIAAADAARFLQEIATLKLHCPPTNARALQVIEKLTRLLRNILTEEEGGLGYASCSFNKPLNTEFAGSASPVYSLPDEDRTDIYEQNVDFNTTCISDDDETIHKQITISRGQNIATQFAGSPSRVHTFTDENNINDIQDQALALNNLNTNHISRDHISHKEMYTSREQTNLNTPKSYIQDMTISQAGNNNVYPKNNFNDDQVIDITNDSDVDEVNETVADSNKQHLHLNTSVEHVNFGVSNMAIHDKVGKPTKLVNDDVNCSQSILENYANDSENEAAANKKDRLVENKSYNEKNTKACVINKVNNYFQKQTSLPVMPSQDVLAPAILSDSRRTLVDFNKYNKPGTQNDALVEKKIEMKKKTENDKAKPKKRRTKKNLKPKHNNTAHTCVHDDLNATTNYKDVTNKSNNINVCDPKTVKKPRKKVHDIYNENVENDLSWVENLRYVREISPSEYDPALSMLQDDFWDNFDLPGTWNDLDFEV